MFYDMTEMATKTIPSFQINQNFKGSWKFFHKADIKELEGKGLRIWKTQKQ